MYARAKPESASSARLVSEAEFFSLPESMDKVELVDGEVYVSPAPTGAHQRLVVRLSGELYLWARSQSEPFEVLIAPVDIRFAPDRILQPDLAVFGERLQLPKSGPIPVVPVLCIEVLSRDRVYDRVTKRMLYAQAGVQEYWTVDPSGTVERWTGEGFMSHAFVTELTTPVLPGFSLKTEDLFRVE